MVITRTDRISTVIGRDESLIDVFVSLSPAFERLRSSSMRKVMSRLVTVEQAARMAGVDADELLLRLNAREHDGSNGATAAKEMQPMSIDGGVRPTALAGVPADGVVELDVREELRAGREPFSMIMAARRRVPEGGALSVRATFEPVPLYTVMKRQGLDHWTEQLGEEDWRVWFYPPLDADDDDRAARAGAAHVQAAVADADDADVVILDVRGLEPPEPMVRTLAALDRLPEGRTLLQINVRVPQFLLPILEQRGFTYEVREQAPDLVRMFIRRNDPINSTAEAAS